MRRILLFLALLLALAAPASAQVSGPWAKVVFGSDSGPTISSGTGSPEGVVTASGGSLYLQTDGASGFTLWTKVGSGNTGWEAPSGGGGGTHNLLSATHPDTAANAPVAGAVLCADGTPTWGRCSPTVAGQVFRFGGTTSAWSTDGTSLSISAANLSTGIIPDARMPNLTGDVTTAEGAVATTIANDAVTTGKIADATILFGDIALNGCTAGQRMKVNAGATGWECGDAGSGGGAPTDASYFTATAEGGLSNETNLGALTTGLLKHTVAAGSSTPATAVPGTDYVTPAGSETLTNKSLGSTLAITAAPTLSDGVKWTFNPDGTNAGLNVGSHTADPSAPANGDLWYDSTANELTARINGSNVALGAGGGGSGSITASGYTMNTARLLGRTTASSGAIEEITVGSGLSLSAGALTATGGGGTVTVGLVNGRLTTESGVPISTSDRTAQSTIYFTPYLGNQIALYDGADWQLETFAELSLALSGLTSGKNYDVFVDYNGGTPQLVLSAAWTTDSTRADALTLQDGVHVKSGATDHRYVGTIRTTGTTTTEDSCGGTTTQVGGKRFVYNHYNRVRRSLAVIDTTDNWSYTTAAWRQANNAAGNKVEFVLGLVGADIEAQVNANAVITGSSWSGSVGVGVDSVTAVSGVRPRVNNNANEMHVAAWRGALTEGYHYIAWIEYGPDVTGVFLGDAGDISQSGLTVSMWN